MTGLDLLLSVLVQFVDMTRSSVTTTLDAIIFPRCVTGRFIVQIGVTTIDRDAVSSVNDYICGKDTFEYYDCVIIACLCLTFCWKKQQLFSSCHHYWVLRSSNLIVFFPARVGFPTFKLVEIENWIFFRSIIIGVIKYTFIYENIFRPWKSNRNISVVKLRNCNS